MPDLTPVFAARVERWRALYYAGKLTAKEFAILLNGLPYTPAKPQADETFESLADISKRVVERLK